MLLKRIVQLFFAILGGTVGFYVGPMLFALLERPPVNFGQVPIPDYIGAVLGAILLIFVTGKLSDAACSWIRWSEERLAKVPAADFIFGVMGLTVGLIVAYLLVPSISTLPVPVLSD